MIQLTETISWNDALNTKPALSEVVLIWRKLDKPFARGSWTAGFWDGRDWFEGYLKATIPVIYWAAINGPED